jgi:hypothetical protein
VSFPLDTGVGETILSERMLKESTCHIRIFLRMLKELEGKHLKIDRKVTFTSA